MTWTVTIRRNKEIDYCNSCCNHDVDEKWSALSKHIRRVENLNTFFITFLVVLLLELILKSNLYLCFGQYISNTFLFHESTYAFIKLPHEMGKIMTKMELQVVQPNGGHITERVVMDSRTKYWLNNYHFYTLNSSRLHSLEHTAYLENKDNRTHSIIR